MNVDSIRKEEFLLGLLVPVFVAIGVTLLNVFDFLYLFFPPLLVAVFLFTLFWKKWGAAVGIISFVVISWAIHWFIPIFWSWIMADNEIIRRLTR
ncbi:MAG TPA: hypothetical protein VK255_02695 [Patescibacteria group bacterium]|nr:hypothetical protein [Patescibacteria group bacterium]